MRAAAIGDIEVFEKIVESKNKISKPDQHRRARFNAALRYAASNGQIGMVKYLLDNGASPLAECPDVAKEVASTVDLVKVLANREKVDSNIRNAYERIMDLFNSHPNALHHLMQKNRLAVKLMDEFA